LLGAAACVRPHEPAQLYDDAISNRLGRSIRVIGIAEVAERRPDVTGPIGPRARGGLLVRIRGREGGLGVTCAVAPDSEIPWPGQRVVVEGHLVWDAIEKFPLVLEDCVLIDEP
jgi:hypothetical protein